MADIKISISDNGVGQITLTRADALHALNEGMCQAIFDALKAWEADDSIHLVLVDHEDGTRGFCAGGDIRMLAESGMRDGRQARSFFSTEYKMNVAIHNFPKPYLSFIDGVTMGGGVGLTVHGTYRVATERTLFAMPETGIGLFPDVGGGWFLPRLRGELGIWLALTGARLKGSDVAAAGIATHFMPSELVSNVKAQIMSADFEHGAGDMLEEILRGATHTVPAGRFEANIEVINRCFAHDEAEDIVAALMSEDEEWSNKQADILSQKSPRAVKVALRQLREGAKFQRFEDNMINEYRIGARQVQSADFLEGVRAVIIDKDHDPKWHPATLEEISDETVDSVFAPLPAGEELAI
jgi:enoyl-CoA hydratase